MGPLIQNKIVYNLSRYFIVLVWLANGLLAKIMNLVPRHELIVVQILNAYYARTLIIIIGVGELCIAAWILIRWKSKWCAWAQIAIVLSMNIIEFTLVPDLLLFGRLNLLIAILFCVLIYFNEFKWKVNVK